MSSLSCTLCLPDELEVTSDTYMEATVEAGGEAHAQFYIECIGFFYEQPTAKLKFDVNNQPSCKIYIDIPIHVNKFMLPKEVNSIYFNRKVYHLLHKQISGSESTLEGISEWEFL